VFDYKYREFAVVWLANIAQAGDSSAIFMLLKISFGDENVSCA
jgi:hypothetical protein